MSVLPALDLGIPLPTTTSQVRQPAVDRARRVAEQVIAPAAADVDERGRFPVEAVEALRAAGLLAAGVPVELGGEGLGLRELCGVIEHIGRACGATATVFAMHSIQVAILARHARTPALTDALRRVVTEGTLIASATTETGHGGDARASTCAVDASGGRFRLEKQAPVISFGEYADAVLVTARRHPGAADNDQVVVLCERPGLVLTPTTQWDSLGYRGSCSRGFVLQAEGDADLVVPEPYSSVSARTMVPYSHLLWGASWVGLASAADGLARAFVQTQARRTPGVLPPGALRLAELTGVGQQLRALVEDTLRRTEGATDEGLDSYAVAIGLNALKVTGSTLVLDVVSRALLTVGMAGYSNRSPYSLGRLLRDAHGAALMLSNDRLLLTNAQLLLAARGE